MPGVDKEVSSARPNRLLIRPQQTSITAVCKRNRQVELVPSPAGARVLQVPFPEPRWQAAGVRPRRLSRLRVCSDEKDDRDRKVDHRVGKRGTERTGGHIALVMQFQIRGLRHTRQSETGCCRHCRRARKSGFQNVKLLTDVNRDSLLAARKSFTEDSKNANWSVVYFAGQGIELNGRIFQFRSMRNSRTTRIFPKKALPSIKYSTQSAPPTRCVSSSWTRAANIRSLQKKNHCRSAEASRVSSPKAARWWRLPPSTATTRPMARATTARSRRRCPAHGRAGS